MSNTERQRRFRKRNPGYYQRLHAKRKAAVQALGEKLAREKAYREIIAPPEPRPMPLCLPAPEQVTPPWVDQLSREIQSAATQRAETGPLPRSDPKRNVGQARPLRS